MKRHRFVQISVAIITVTFLVIFGTLLLADNWPLPNAQGAVSSCALQGPLKWFGCVLSAHEALSGGLIGAGGTIFAAWIAASAVWQQINDARAAEKRLSQAISLRYLVGMRDLVSYYDAILTQFDNFPGTADNRCLNGLDALYKAGKLISFNGEVPSIFATRAETAWQTLKELRALSDEINRLNPGAPKANDHAELNKSVKNAVEEIRGFRGHAFTELDQMQQTAIYPVNERYLKSALLRS